MGTLFEHERKQCLCKKFIPLNKQGRLIFFSYDLLTVNDCLSDSLENTKCGANSSLQTIRTDYLNKLIFAHMRINSVQNKFDSLADIIKNNIDILMISETNEDDTFPDGQISSDGFGTPYCLDRNRKWSGYYAFH